MVLYALFPRYMNVTPRKRLERTHLRFGGLVLKFGRFDAENVQLETSSFVTVLGLSADKRRAVRWRRVCRKMGGRTRSWLFTAMRPPAAGEPLFISILYVNG